VGGHDGGDLLGHSAEQGGCGRQRHEDG
jgi:hypothetical protein